MDVDAVILTVTVAILAGPRAAFAGVFSQHCISLICRSQLHLVLIRQRLAAVFSLLALVRAVI